MHTIYIHIHVSKYLCKNYFVNNNSIKIYNQIMWGIYINNKWQKYINILYNNMWISIIYITSMWILITIQKKYSEIKRENKYSEMKREGWKNNTLFVIHLLFFFFFKMQKDDKRGLFVQNLLEQCMPMGCSKTEESELWTQIHKLHLF